MRTLLLSFVCGLLFAVGLVVSGMTLPTKVTGFLDVTGQWDPSLAFVMGGAVVVNAILYRLTRRRASPLFAVSFSMPKRSDIDPRLVVGAIVFGVGWGLGGMCPGPAITAAASLDDRFLVFTGAMIIGIGLFQLWDRVTAVEK